MNPIGDSPPLAREAAKALGISPRLLWQLTKDGHIPCVRVGSGKRRTVLYPLADLQAFGPFFLKFCSYFPYTAKLRRHATVCMKRAAKGFLPNEIKGTKLGSNEVIGKEH